MGAGVRKKRSYNKDQNILRGLISLKKCDIFKEKDALYTIQSIINSGRKAEVFMGKNGIVVIEATRILKYETKDER